MKKLVRIRKIFLVLLCILIAFVAKTYLFNKKESEGNVKEKQEVLEQDIDYIGKMLQGGSMIVNKMEEVISNEIEFIVLKEKGSLELFHDKTPKNNKYIEWLVDSNIYFKVYYTAILTIDAENIKVVYDDALGRINIIYDFEKIKVKSVNIDNILSETSKSVFGRAYSAEETSALTLIATDNIKEKISNDNRLKYLASINLEEYLRNLSYRLGVYNVSIVKK